EFINRLLSLLPHEDGSPKGTVYLEAKTYHLTDSILLGAYQTLIGSGQSTVLKMDSTIKPIIEVKTPSTDGYIYGVTIKNMRLEGNFNNIGIYLKKSSHVLIENVYIYFIDIGIKADSAWLAHYNRVT